VSDTKQVESNNVKARAFGEGLSPHRLAALSDGIFAIAMTLLILDVKLPPLPADASEALLGQSLLEMLPKIGSYVLSFVVLGVYWVSHQAVFHYIRHTNRFFLWINLIFLMCVAFLPFSTGFLSQFTASATSSVFYGFTLGLTGAALGAVQFYATTNHFLIDSSIPHQLIKAGRRRINLMAIAYFLIALTAFVSVRASQILYLLTPLIYMLPSRVDHLWTDVTQTEKEVKNTLPRME